MINGGLRLRVSDDISEKIPAHNASLRLLFLRCRYDMDTLPRGHHNPAPRNALFDAGSVAAGCVTLDDTALTSKKQSLAIQPSRASYLHMGRWAHITVTLDSSKRLYLARCVRCGHLIAAGKDRTYVEGVAANHHCEMKSKPVPQKKQKES